MTVDKAVIKFKEDTGVKVTVISDAIWKTLNFPQPLQKTISSLCGLDHNPLKVLGRYSFLSITYIQRKMLHTTSLRGEEYEE